MSLRILKVAVATEVDVVNARQRAREVAALSGFAVQDQVRIATSVSELARNIINYAGKGKVEFSIEGEGGHGQVLRIRIEDRGPGIRNLDVVLSGRYKSQTGMGLGILGARRLMDRCDIDSVPGEGTTIILEKALPPDAPRVTAQNIGELANRAASAPGDMLGELRQQNQELLGTLAELKSRQDELLQLTRELEDTNRGVVALYAELDEKAEHLRRADETKSRFLSNMSHEFRTPLSSIRALATLLLNRVDGDLTPEQEKQVSFILQGSVALSDMVNDLLDLAKIEAGKVDVRAEKFDVGEMLRALRGMLRPLVNDDAPVTLTFQEPSEALSMYTDEGKLSQILRNFVSNALKFTERGEVVVRAELLAGEECVRFSVSDTGLGIDAAHLQIIFEEFGQVENHLQVKAKGTGLGLPLCRNLANLLNGSVSVESTPGKGSVFSVTLPIVYTEKTGDSPPSRNI